MLRPSTAPRWNRHTNTRPPGARPFLLPCANTARVRNSGSSPRLTMASPPALSTARRVIFMIPPGCERILLLLELGTAERQAHRERARPCGALEVADLPQDHAAGVRGHRASQHVL